MGSGFGAAGSGEGRSAFSVWRRLQGSKAPADRNGNNGARKCTPLLAHIRGTIRATSCCSSMAAGRCRTRAGYALLSPFLRGRTSGDFATFPFPSSSAPSARRAQHSCRTYGRTQRFISRVSGQQRTICSNKARGPSKNAAVADLKGILPTRWSDMLEEGFRARRRFQFVDVRDSVFATAAAAQVLPDPARRLHQLRGQNHQTNADVFRASDWCGAIQRRVRPKNFRLPRGRRAFRPTLASSQ